MKSIGRARFIAGVGAGFIAAGTPIEAATMHMVNQRPYDWSTPPEELGKSLYTPNDVFFIRSHMGPPPSIDIQTWALTVDGLVTRPLHLTLEDLKKYPRHEVPAVVQCAGNGRWYYGIAYPTASHPAGAQWRTGGVGNARFAGARVRDVLATAGVKSGARFSTNAGLDNPLLPTTPKVIRSTEIEKLMDEDTLLAYEMNGTPLPYYHGYPVRLLVPGWAADHSVKWLSTMTLAAEPTANFWTAIGYRYPNKLGPPGKGVKPTAEHPVTGLVVKSIIMSPAAGASVRRSSPVTVSGFAWSGDGAYVTTVDVSVDGGNTWHAAKLGESAGKYSWRTFTFTFTPNSAGAVVVMARARDNRGAVQPLASPWNPGGYLWNGIQKVSLEVRNA
jgi:sulfite oxidase